MSRRIAYWLLATAAVLIAAPASADRECFENSCRMPDLFEPSAAASSEAADEPTQVEPAAPEPARVDARKAAAPVHAGNRVVTVPSAAPLEPARAEVTSEANRDAVVEVEPVRAQPPVGVYPQMVIDPAPRKVVEPPQRRVADPAPVPARPAPRYSDDARPRAPLLPPAPVAARPAAPAVPVVAPAPVPAPVRTAVPAAPVAAPVVAPPPASRPAVVQYSAQPRARAAQQQAYGMTPGYVLGEGAAHAAPVVAVTPVVYAAGQVVADPSWKVCQTDARDGYGQLCGPPSYQPYGAYGYRPYRTHRGYRSAPVYVFAPDAKVISVDTDD